MSGPTRLAVLLTVIWSSLAVFLLMASGGDAAAAIALLDATLTALTWGAWWVWRGFRPAKQF